MTETKECWGCEVGEPYTTHFCMTNELIKSLIYQMKIRADVKGVYLFGKTDKSEKVISMTNIIDILDKLEKEFLE